MLHIDDAVFAPSWSRYYFRLATGILATLIGAWACSRFFAFFEETTQLIAILLLSFGVPFFFLVPIFLDRKEQRVQLYLKHLNALPVDTLEKYAERAVDKREEALISDVLAMKTL